ncbi:MAG: fatty acid desaturase family protein [Pseudomonadota bacterium]
MTANINDILTAAQIAQVRRKSNLRGLWCVACQWGITITIFAVTALFPNPATIAVGTLLLGGRQLGFFVLTHECGHRSLFKSSGLNRFVETWLLSPADFSNGKSYMREHLEHHRSVGQASDPDLNNYQDYPITRERLRRKLKRDLRGQTGWRTLSFKLRAIANLDQQTPEDKAALLRGVVINLAMLITMAAFGVTWLYLMWIAAMIFVYPTIARIRQIAEHADVPQLTSPDPRKNTRTLYANPLVRLLICPHGVNYHIEHHLLASAPIYRLATMHRWLKQNDYYEGVTFSRGYISLLKRVTI